MAGRRWLGASGVALLILLVACTGGVAPTPSPTTPATPTATAVVAATPSDAPSTAPTASPSPSAGPTVEPLPSGLDPEVVAAIEWRRSMGLNTNPAFVIAVMADPKAIDAWRYPILQGEEDWMVERQQMLHRYLPAVKAYAAAHEDVFGGVYMDNEHSRVMTLWASDAEAHLAAILEVAGTDAPIAARQVRWSERELRDLQDRIDRQWPGFAAAHAKAIGWGADTIGNVLEVDVSSANPDAPRLIAMGLAQELGVPPEMFLVLSDGTGVELLGTGWVKGVVTMADGSRPGRNDLSIDGDPVTIGYCGGGDVGYGVGADGWFEIPCKVGDYMIQVWDHGGGARAVIGEARVTVREGETTRVRIRLDR